MKISFYLSSLFFLGVLFLIGCKTYQNLEDIKPRYSGEANYGELAISDFSKLNPGDELIIQTKKGDQYFMDFRQMKDGPILVGEAWSFNLKEIDSPVIVEIPISEIANVEVKRINTPLTIFLPVLVGGALFLVILGASLSNAL